MPSTNRTTRWVLVGLWVTLALGFGLATGCFNSTGLNPNYVPSDSVNPDSGKSPG